MNDGELIYQDKNLGVIIYNEHIIVNNSVHKITDKTLVKIKEGSFRYHPPTIKSYTRNFIFILALAVILKIALILVIGLGALTAIPIFIFLLWLFEPSCKAYFLLIKNGLFHNLLLSSTDGEKIHEISKILNDLISKRKPNAKSE